MYNTIEFVPIDMELTVNLEDAEKLAASLKEEERAWTVWILEDSTTGKWISAEDVSFAINYIPENIDIPGEVTFVSEIIRIAIPLYSCDYMTKVIFLEMAQIPVLWLVAQVLNANHKAILADYRKDQALGRELFHDDRFVDEDSIRCNITRLELAITKFDEFIQLVIAGSSEVVFRRQLFLPHQHDEFVEFHLKKL